ncbi:MAG: PhnD/SsuA/transferrin family substrate-binding protein [Polaromonas sp.]|nr:PhnD/SsuA/transferrin family substrate-binding protein [Polaromonas sp.]
MNNPSLQVAVGDYDRTRPLIDGSVAFPGFDANVMTGDLEDIFAKAFREATFDVTELSFSNYLIATSRDECPYAALPIFPSRSFRHSAIYVRSDRTVQSPSDLRGKRIGCREYSNTASLVVRGFLFDEYGLVPEASEWVIGDVDHVERESIDDRNWPKDRVKIKGVVGQTLTSLLLNGEIDALIAYKPPVEFIENNKMTRLFPDWRSAEKDYFRRTQRFPIMHLMAARKDVLASHPSVVDALMDGFTKAKGIAQARLSTHQAHPVMLPWLTAEHEATQALMGTDFWPYGLDKNMEILNTQIRWSYQQGLIPRQFEVNELFHPLCR